MPETLSNVRASVVTRARRLMQHKFRLEDQAFLVEGPQACREAARFAVVERLFVTDDAAARYDDIVAEVERKGGQVVAATQDVVSSLSDSVAPAGMVAVVRALTHSVASVIRPNARLVVALSHARDPGNAGAVIRVADAAGADGVLVSVESVDATNPKVVRTTAGSLFHLPVVQEVDLDQAIAAARAAGLQILAADGAGVPLATVDLSRPTMWVFGNEAWGLAAHTAALADQVVALPIYGKAESLNLATAAAVLLYASAQAQRSAE